MSHLVISNLLCFLSSQYDKADEESIFSTISEFYSFEESIEAKQLLVNECDKLGLLNLIDELRKPRQNGVENRKVVNDILDIWNVIEYQTAGQTLSTFVAVDPKRLPPANNKKPPSNNLTYFRFAKASCPHCNYSYAIFPKRVCRYRISFVSL